MSRDWVPAGSQPYGGGGGVAPNSRPSAMAAGSVPYQGTVANAGRGKLRSPKQCKGNNNTCKGFKSGGTDFCVGHRKSIAKEAAGGSEDS